MKATLKNYRQSPRKVRLVADLVRGKPVQNAISVLSHMPKKASAPITKLLRSAVANAAVKGAGAEALSIKKIEVNQGIVFKRFRPRARGRSAPIRKKTSNVTVELAQQKPRP